ncbi:MAG: hypothetical protein ACRDPR_21210 [Nocardioidaceae bacterium]
MEQRGDPGSHWFELHADGSNIQVFGTGRQEDASSTPRLEDIRAGLFLRD